MAYGRAKPLARSLFELLRRRSGAAEGPLSVRWHAGAGAGETTGEEAVLIQNALHSSRTHIKLKSSPVQPPPQLSRIPSATRPVSALTTTSATGVSPSAPKKPHNHHHRPAIDLPFPQGPHNAHELHDAHVQLVPRRLAIAFGCAETIMQAHLITPWLPLGTACLGL